MSRFRTDGDGYTTWHVFSSGAHYDPDRTGWGPLVALDEHLVAPGGGFDWHPHRGVHIASWVLEGTLRHEDSAGTVREHGPGAFLVQSTGDGLRHRETNAATVPLRMVQLVVLGDAPYSVRAATPPAAVGPLTVDVLTGSAPDGAAVYDLASGEFRPGDGATLVLRRDDLVSGA